MSAQSTRRGILGAIAAVPLVGGAVAPAFASSDLEAPIAEYQASSVRLTVGNEASEPQNAYPSGPTRLTYATVGSCEPRRARGAGQRGSGTGKGKCPSLHQPCNSGSVANSEKRASPPMEDGEALAAKLRWSWRLPA